jgi:hypothetical protein
MDFAGISEEDQYASTLPAGLAVPVVFPEWAYAEELKASQKRIFKEREQKKSRAPREAVEFVSAVKPRTSDSTDTPAGKGTKEGATEKVISSQSKEQPDQSSSHIAGKRKELEHRSRDTSESRSKRRSRSRSPKRRRSRSG